MTGCPGGGTGGAQAWGQPWFVPGSALAPVPDLPVTLSPDRPCAARGGTWGHPGGFGDILEGLGTTLGLRGCPCWGLGTFPGSLGMSLGDFRDIPGGLGTHQGGFGDVPGGFGDIPGGLGTSRGCFRMSLGVWGRCQGSGDSPGGWGQSQGIGTWRGHRGHGEGDTWPCVPCVPMG